MFVKDRMTVKPITLLPETSVSEALSMMRQNQIRRMPVLNKKGQLIGIVSEKDLLYASPSPATSLNVYEIGYLLSKLKIKEIMQTALVTVPQDMPIEEAAKIMIDNNVSGLPVMDGDKLVGIITETDVFKTLMEMMGARDAGIRVTVVVPDKPGVLNAVTGAIAAIGGDIVTIGTFYSESQSHGKMVIKVCCVEQTALRKALESVEVVTILDIQNTNAD